MVEQKNSPKSLGMLAGSMVAFGTIGLFRRAIPLSSGVIAFWRGMIGAAFLFGFVKLRGKQVRTGIGWRKGLLLALSGAFIGFNWILLFEAYRYTSVPIATLCYYMEPILVVLASCVLFQEKLTMRKGICSVLAFVGMVFVSGVLEGGALSRGEGKGILLGLGAAVLYSCVVLLNKGTAGVDAYEKTIIQLFSAGATMGIFLLLTGGFSEPMVSVQAVLLLLVVGVFHTGICYALYFGSMDGLRTQTVALFSYIDPITALVLSAIFLGEKLNILGLVGAVLILGSALASELGPR